MQIRFSKMHGLGNDFMVLDGINQTLPELTREQITHLANRHFGVGFDQLLLVEKPQSADAEFRYRIFNADGSEVGPCGNGARCFARFVVDKGRTKNRRIPVETASGRLELLLDDNDQITVNMGAPRWSPEDIPLHTDAEADSYFIIADKQAFEVGAVGLGNPHCTLLVESVDTAKVEFIGPLLESHPDFPARVNVGFMQLLSRNHIRLRVYERGSGETLACGSGACAAVVIGQRRGFLDHTVQVDLPGGSLSITYTGEGGILMTGPATLVYEGVIDLPEK